MNLHTQYKHRHEQRNDIAHCFIWLLIHHDISTRKNTYTQYKIHSKKKYFDNLELIRLHALISGLICRHSRKNKEIVKRRAHTNTQARESRTKHSLGELHTTVLVFLEYLRSVYCVFNIQTMTQCIGLLVFFIAGWPMFRFLFVCFHFSPFASSLNKNQTNTVSDRAFK